MFLASHRGGLRDHGPGDGGLAGGLRIGGAPRQRIWVGLPGHLHLERDRFPVGGNLLRRALLRELSDSEVEKLRLAVVAKDAQLRVLLSQVNPHFIFNCLNSLRALIIEDPPRAQSMVTELAGMLRYSLQSGKTEAVSLETELEAVSAYLKLEGYPAGGAAAHQNRYGSRIA